MPFNLIQIKKLNEDATIPTKANKTDAGYDLYSIEDYEIPRECKKGIRTGISMAIPDGYVGLIWPRSGLAAKYAIDTLAGVIDSGYRGEVIVLLQNHGPANVKINKGDRVAQILFQSIAQLPLLEVKDLEESDRGENGFGSSGN